MEIISFEDLGLDQVTLAAVSAKGFTEPTPIQVLAIPRLLNGDANVIARARTGTGKTAAFGLPLVQTIRQDKPYPQALILTPTRELALQVCKEITSFSTGTYPRLASVYGGQSMGEQLRKLRSGVEIVVGTPGRVKDHLERGSLKLENISYFILDEADEMLDMGFIDDIEQIFSKANPSSRVLLFSATMPPAILKIAQRFMGEYEIVEEEERPEEPILTEQRYILVRESDKIEALVRIIDAAEDFYGLIFTQTKADADMVSRELDERGYEAAALHGDIPQSQREKILGRFRNKKTRVLVATDVAARGIDIEGLTHVVNYALPFDGPTYIHRIGRTGRAGARGIAYTLVRPEERRKLEYIRSVSKGNLAEGKIPTVQAVIAAKRGRLVDEMFRGIGIERFADAVLDSEDSCDADFAEAESGGDAVPEMDAADRAPQALKLPPADDEFVSLADELCAGCDARGMLASVLQYIYGEKLDPARYRDIIPVSGGNGAGSRRPARLYVGLGRRDGMDKRDIAAFFSKLLSIPGRLVDRIEITENFSLVTLPGDAVASALEMGKRDRTLPHMHLDTKSEGPRFGREGRPDRPQGDRFRGGGFRRDGDSRRPQHGGHEQYGRRGDYAQGGASLYKRPRAANSRED